MKKAHQRAIKAAREELIEVARATIKAKDDRNDLNQQVKRLQHALDAYKAAEAFTHTVHSIKKQADIHE